jgi:hypothetical protein
MREGRGTMVRLSAGVESLERVFGTSVYAGSRLAVSPVWSAPEQLTAIGHHKGA